MSEEPLAADDALVTAHSDRRSLAALDHLHHMLAPSIGMDMHNFH